VTVAAALLHAGLTPLALGGEAAEESGGTGTAIAVVSAISIVVGYVMLYLLWRYVFSAKAKARRGEPPEH
jgi:heme/copper-type cytochrome/quinol oxidase subunit 2